jgi:hypothetical protein
LYAWNKRHVETKNWELTYNGTNIVFSNLDENNDIIRLKIKAYDVVDGSIFGIGTTETLFNIVYNNNVLSITI